MRWRVLSSEPGVSNDSVVMLRAVRSALAFSCLPLTPVFGHAGLRKRLAGALASSTLPSAFLLEGPRGVGKQRLAIWLARAIVCDNRTAAGEACEQCQSCRFSRELRHPDLYWVFPEERPKDSDPTPTEVRQRYDEAIA